ncbi:YqcC family protein [Pseudomonas sp. G11-1]|uniref:YqcC family protein n=1 Tax=Halopseudomonas bauzanensis TaxID=653930 RepID=A0A031M6I4_9GAMM|nr:MULTISPECIES: YqcC family protein [Halopseudomonas]MCO5787869.1 YqcC family protein [Pseudomonas sp. G11-1]MCO5791173.1 YqcC family protein [Pseudomonas sp. G11-2]EZQ15575.1 tRNA pseudouridine synthase C [Halopseudomonas bauzanensis]TKA89487.1 YqcC family protein [Halopseudomonas bauzanensis]WGK62100.1 YqcC family protein [Halopseudomonas sp. SMJS2]
MHQWHALADALLELEQELRALSRWSAQAPSAAALSSQQPFCVDTLDFEMWLQWIFIPRMLSIIENNGPMPAGCNILPMGEEAFAPLGRRGHGLRATLGRIDQLAVELAAQG